ncbi:MAG: ABC transporter permease [Geminicoccaceae bacterium]
MLGYALRRSGLSLAIVGLVMLGLFALLHLMPGDPAAIALGPRATPEVRARYAAKMHLDQPMLVQLGVFAGNILRGDLGEDLFSGRPVTSIVMADLGRTLILAAAGLGWSAVLGIALGCLSAVHPNGWFDRITGVIAVGTIAVPSFLVSIWALLVFAIWLGWLPVIGAGEPGDFRDQAYHLILPAFAVGLGWVGYLARMVRASMLEVLGENYVRAARAAGLTERKVVWSYALRMAILPTVTMLGIGFGSLLTGAVFAEIIFARPGLGKLVYDMVETRNFPVVQGAVLVMTTVYVAVALLADLAVAWLDPRVRHAL